MMSGGVPPMVHEGNLAENFKIWSQRLKIYMTANDLDKASEARKIAILLNNIGSKGITIYNSFCDPKKEEEKFDEVLDKFEKHFSPRKNLMILRNEFFIIKQNGGERLDEYFTKVVNLGLQCELGNLQDQLIATKIISGLDRRYDELKTRLISEEDSTLTLKYVTTFLKNAEASRLYVKGEQDRSLEAEVLVAQQKGNRHPSRNPVQTIKNCRNCGKTHQINKCPAYGKTCYNCNKNNHFSNMCMKKKVHMIHEEEDDIEDSEEAGASATDHFFIGLASTSTKSSGNEITQDFFIKNKVINVKMDTGAGCNIISSEVCKMLNIPKEEIKQCNKKVVQLDGKSINVHGTCKLVIRHPNKNSYSVEFIIIEGSAPTLLGCKTCMECGFIRANHQLVNVHNVDLKENKIPELIKNLKTNFSEQFDGGLGCLPNTVKLQLREDAVPIVQAARRVPFSLLPELREELEIMEQMGVIEKVTKPTKWVNSLVLVRKPNKKLRICLDPRALNKYIIQPKFQLPTLDELKSKMQNAKVFALLDASNGFWMQKLDEPSSDLCTFQTPFGRYKFLRMPFGISAAPEEFCRIIAQMFENIEGVCTYLDDVCVWASSIAELNDRLNNVLKIASQNGIKFNGNKCKFFVKELLFIGHKFTSKGVTPDPSKVEAVVKMETPKCKKDLERFLGSTTDLTPTLIGIYDSFLEPKSLRPETSALETAKDARNDPPVNQKEAEDKKDNAKKDPAKMVGSVKLPVATVNKSSLYTIRPNCNGANESDLTSDNHRIQRTFKDKVSETSTFDNLSPNVKRMISSATDTTTLKFQKKGIGGIRSSTRHRSNIPLVGATSKISQSGVDILPSVEIYDQPCGLKGLNKKSDEESPSKSVPLKPDFRIDEQTTYDVPTNNRPAIYDVPSTNKTAFESLSLPYIDQSIELSISSNDREFDIKLSSKDNSPQKPEPKKEVPSDTFPNGTNSLNRKDFVSKNESPSKLAKTAPYPEVVSSTGNLKVIPVKETLHPPPEVTRPLSMSSIASSSSTSSSGVQNKGGVNSAYLASIESLDDHSDADVVSGNGSNHFVNKEGHNDTIPRQSWHEPSGPSQLERVCAEIVQTENVYVEDLRQVVEGYLHEWRREAAFSDNELSELFNNIEHIYGFNRSLCEELNSCRLDATCIARCFVNNTTGFSVYTSYCTGYPRTMACLAALASKPHSAREFRERQLALGHPLPLASYLLKPVQRILKYHLLLQNVVKQCATPETEYALLQMTGIAQHIDDMKRRHEHAVRVQEIQSLLYGWTGPDLTTYGELCAEGTFRVFGAKAMRHAFLFDKMLLVTKNREDGILAYKSHIMCNNMMLVEAIAGAPLSFHVIPWDAPRAQLTLQARSQRHKREWTLLLKRVILENYNAVIPSHARQLVMELGQNKTDDDMLAEKSHNLITQASMRKQLSAPEYLEKRKVERERRKSFENGIRGRLKKVNTKYTVPVSRSTSQDCDCAQVSLDKGTDYTCDNCYIDLCSDCETEMSKKEKECSCKHDDERDKCTACDRAMHFIDSGSAEHLERKQSVCKCSDFKSSQESFAKDYNSLNKIRGYHSSDNIVGYTDTKSKDDLSDTNNSLVNVRNIPKSCLKCAKIKENIVTESTSTIHSRKSRCNDSEKQKTDTLRSKSKEDPQRSKLSKIGTWRRKSEPGLQQNTPMFAKKSIDSDNDRHDSRGTEKIEFECRNCGSNKISRKTKNSENVIISDPELDARKVTNTALKANIEIKMYNTKKVPKKISKIKKSRANGLRLGTDTTAKFYADFSTDVSTENILHISESNDSLNVDKTKSTPSSVVPETISKDEDIDEETYKKLIEKTDSFKKNELEKGKYLNQQKVINEGSENEDKLEVEIREDVPSGEEVEQPLEQIISQLLLQNREFQKLLKKQQLRNSAQRRHQRLLKSHSNPEKAVNKPKYGRQTSENLHSSKDEPDVQILSPPNEVNDPSDDDHIYETLRVENRVDESLHTLNDKSKSIQHVSRVPRPKRLPSPPNPAQIEVKNTTESDYVYLSFDKLNKLQDAEGIYDVPVKSPEKVKPGADDLYEPMEHQGPPVENSTENLYDSLMEVCRRKKETPNNLPEDYLPMSPDQQSPNTPEIWLSRQKEHFNVSRDRKSGSLPRSFQVVTNNQEDNNLSSFKCKPNSNSKTYLNRDGKVMSTDRPYTIASDKSEISYDDVENYMSEGDILKFNKSGNSNDTDYLQNFSQSTLELEQEIDKCYKNNFEKDLDANKNEHLAVSQPNLNMSTTSSCEVLPLENNEAKKEINIHPEHKIYKPASNMLSLKNVLSRFKNRTPPKNNEEEINANDQNSPDSGKSDAKSPTTEKRPGLNPRSYSKNLLQRFRSIIGDEHADDNQNRPVTRKASEDNTVKSDIKVVITSTDNSPTTSTVVYAGNDALSKSVYEKTTLTESQSEKNNLEPLSHSCDNIPQNHEVTRQTYEKSLSTVTAVSNNSSPSRSNSNSYQSLNKLPIYMQGSKHLGARIAQSDYVDPTTLAKERSTLKNVNVLINKNAIRPDSLFSNSSFVTSSSESAYQESNKQEVIKEDSKEQPCGSTVHGNSDESYYEKSFEKIEQVIDEEIFRDSAVYSDQEETEEPKTQAEAKTVSKTVSRIESMKHNTSFRAQSVTVTSSVHTKASVTKKTVESHVNTKIETKSVDKGKPKAPPVPIKPKITNIPTVSNVKTVASKVTLAKTKEQSSSSESVNMKTIKRTTSFKPVRAETVEQKSEVKVPENVKDETDSSKFKPVGNIQMKRLSFERTSLDSATRKTKVQETKKITGESQKTSKSVMERRMEIEMMSKSLTKPSQTQIAKKPLARPKSISTKVASFERSVSDYGNNKKELKFSVSVEPSVAIPKEEIREEVTSTTEIEDPKASWVKQVVNKFQ